MTLRRRLIFSLLLLIGLYVLTAAGYAVLEGVSPFDAFCMSAITLSTVGFGEHIELDRAGRTWTMIVISLGVGVSWIVFTSVVSAFVSGDVRSPLRSRRLQSEIEQIQGHVILCGYGRMGTLVVDDVQRRHLSIVVVECATETLRSLSREGIPNVRGDATEEDVLLRAGLMRCNALVTILAHDADNLFVTLTARALRPDMTIVARGELPRTEAKLICAGATKVVCPQVVGASRITNFLTRPNVVDMIEFVVGPDSSLCDATLRDSPIRERTGASVVAIKRQNGETIYHPIADECIRSHDTLIMIGRVGVSTRLHQL